MRVRFVDKAFKHHSYMVACRIYNPSSDLRVTNAASTLLHDWTLDCLAEVGVERQHLFAATSDAGSDVKCCLTERFSLPWEWCGPHMLNRAAEESYGYTDKVENSKNLEARKNIQDVRAMVTSVRQSPILKVIGRTHRFCSYRACVCAGMRAVVASLTTHVCSLRAASA